MSLGSRRRIGSTSVEYLHVPISHRIDGGYEDLSGKTVTMALTVKPETGGYNEPAAAVYTSASVVTIDDVFYARVLIGPGSSWELSEGRWQVWVKVNDSVEDPVLFGGEIEIY